MKAENSIIAVAVSVATLTGFALSTGAMTVTAPPVSYTPLTHICPPGDRCTTTLSPWSQVAPPSSSDPLKTLLNDVWHWKMVPGEPLADEYEVTITMYAPHLCDGHGSEPGSPWGTFDSHCIHGAELRMVFASGADGPRPGVGQRWAWIQVADLDGTHCLSSFWPRDPFIDVLPAPPNPPPPLPYYPWPCENFQDRPQDGCTTLGHVDPGCHADTCVNPDPCHWSMNFTTYLVIGPVDPNAPDPTVTVYNGIKWGFTADCVPTPSAVWAGVALLAALLLKRRLRIPCPSL